MKHAFIEAEKVSYPVRLLCKVLEVAESGFYAARKRPESPRRREDRRLTAHVCAAFKASQETYGSPRLVRELKDEGLDVGRHRVRKLMREAKLVAKSPRRFVVTTDSAHGRAVSENLVKRRWAELATAPNRLWVGDITYLRTWEGWTYLAVFLDVFSRKVVGFKLADSMESALVTSALELALCRRRPAKGLLVHTDQGAQYVSDDYRELVARAGAVPSMSRRGNCWDTQWIMAA